MIENMGICPDHGIVTIITLEQRLSVRCPVCGVQIDAQRWFALDAGGHELEQPRAAA